MNSESILRTLHRLRNRKKYRALHTEFLGLPFLNPVGLASSSVRTGKQAVRFSDLGLGFVVMDLSSQEIRQTVSQLVDRNKETWLAAEISSDIVRTFSLFYDFADLFIINPDSLAGVQSPEIPDICDILDELLSLRLCYENYKPVLLRLSPGYTPDEIRSLLDFCQLSGIDGIAVSAPSKVKLVADYTQGRLPILASAVGSKPVDARELFINGAALVETGPGFNKARRLLQTLIKQPLDT